MAAIATVLVASACSSSGSSGDAKQATLSKDGKGKKITVWLMDDAQKGWPSVVEAAKKQFKEETGADVDIQWQTWTNYTTKLDTALLSGNAPEVVELGNTQTAKYIEALLRRPDRREGPVRELGQVPGLAGRLRPDPGRLQDLRRPVLRRRPRPDLPQGPVRRG
ncbi:extracellular solute-binding protein [Kitasatospora arboriphila]